MEELGYGGQCFMWGLGVGVAIFWVYDHLTKPGQRKEEGSTDFACEEIALREYWKKLPERARIILRSLDAENKLESENLDKKQAILLAMEESGFVDKHLPGMLKDSEADVAEGKCPNSGADCWIVTWRMEQSKCYTCWVDKITHQALRRELRTNPKDYDK